MRSKKWGITFMTIRNTKIVATLGPSSFSKDVIRRMIESGIDVARINFSHGTHQIHAKTIKTVRKTASALGRSIGILQDLCGPKIRIDSVFPSICKLKKGARFVISIKKTAGSCEKVSVSEFPALVKSVKTGERILINDGAVCLRVEKIKGNDVICNIIRSGSISTRKGLNLPDTHLTDLPSLTRKDQKDLIFGLQQGVDFVALSFVRSAKDIINLKALIRKAGSKALVIAKIEKHEALEHLEEIVKESDAIMVARGDLGVETDLETVAIKQKEIIKLCNFYGKTVITATQMLESMIQNPTPTRAEVSDVTNAIFDGTDALMLSGETAVGAYPVETVAQMARIAKETEDSLDAERFLKSKPINNSTSDAVAHAACLLTREIKADAIITPTLSGATACMISRYRPLPPIITVTPNKHVLNQLKLVWGIYPFLIKYKKNTDDIIKKAKKTAIQSGIVKKGNTVIICAGNPTSKPGTTDLIKIEKI